MITILDTPARRKWTRAEKQTLAREWRSSGLTQTEFCALPHVGISVRALRYWVREYAPPEPTAVSVTELVRRAASALRLAADSLDCALVSTPPRTTGEHLSQTPSPDSTSRSTTQKFTFED